MSANPGRRGPRIATVIAGVLAWSWLAAAPIDVIRDCAAKASPAISGIKDLGAACPQLEEAIRSLDLAPMLFDGWQGRMNRDVLRGFANLAENYAGPRPRASPDVAALPAILKALAREQIPLPQSWWDAFRAWFKSWLARHSDQLSWLDDWLEQIGKSTTLFHVVSYALVGLVLMAAVAVVVNEIKAGGVSRRRAAPAAAAADTAAVCADSEGPEPTALADRLTELLRILVSRLMQTRRLEAERSLTHRELVARGNFDNESQRAVFAAVAGAAESIVYGARSGAPDQLNRVLSEGRALLAQLSDPSSAH